MHTSRATLRSKLPAALRRPAGEPRRGEGAKGPDPARRAPKRSLNEAAHKLDR